jgi:uncharacterized protein (TIGR00255 family)
MTGFGLGAAPLGEGRALCEIRSLNHRFLDVRVRVPVEIADQAFFVEQLARERLGRGRYDVNIRVEGSALAAPKPSLARARAAYQMLRELRDEVAPGADVPLSAVLAFPDVLPTACAIEPGPMRESLEAAFVAAVGALDAMRSREGEALARELGARLGCARRLQGALAERAADLVESQRVRLKTRIERLLGDSDVSLDRGRLELELALLADKSDITEELVRLGSHFDQLAELFAQGGPVGRRLDFLLQEVSREVNTIGSKCQDSAVAHLVVELKTEVERMREQVQNVE